MKPYTDIEQSKKLAEILPIESADGYWFKGFPCQPYMVYTKGTPNPSEHIPCWSLAALLDVLPKVIDRDYVINITQNSKNTWFITYDLLADRDCSFNGLISKSNSLVDACYKMIIKLNEMNLL